MSGFEFKRFFLSCGRKLLPKTSDAITEEALSKIEETTEKTRESADELELEINADCRRLKTLNLTAPDQKPQQVQLMRKIKMQKNRLATLRNMELSTTQAGNDSRDALLVAANAEAHSVAMKAQRAALKKGKLSPDKIESVLHEIELGKDAISDAASVLGSHNQAHLDYVDEYDVDAFLMNEFGPEMKGAAVGGKHLSPPGVVTSLPCGDDTDGALPVLPKPSDAEEKTHPLKVNFVV